MEETTDLLQDLEPQFTEASKGIRLGNYLIDLVLIYLLIFFAAYGMALLAPSLMLDPDTGEVINFTSYLITIAILVGYYFLFELYSGGRTIGKLITGTAARRSDGKALTPKDALLRSLIRLIPFEVLSGLGVRPWHDSWSHTTVVVL
ncbi:hypothetical protein GCM10027051_10870 [Niabella terrae]